MKVSDIFRRERLINNVVNWTYNKFGFTLIEFIVLVVSLGLVLLLTLR